MNDRLTVAIIPARGGSKGVSGKNLRRVGGVPLVERAVQASASAVDLVVVSTEDAAIAAVARDAGARVVDRPAELSGDEATSESALLHALDVLEGDGVPVGTVAFVQATSPFIPAEGIAEAVALIEGGTYDSVFSACETYGFLWRRDAGGAAAAINHDAAHRPRRQDREPHYLETGAFYAFDATGFRRFRHRFFGLVGIVTVPERMAIEIDDEDQLALAEALAAASGSRQDLGVPRHSGCDPTDPSEILQISEAPDAVRPGRAGSAASGTTPIPALALVTDFDGVHTDDSATVDEHGNESVRVSREDGMGVARLRRAGIPMLILSTEQNPVVARRAEKLQIPVLHGVDDKASALAAWAAERGIRLEDIAYVGNDVNDLGPLGVVGWPVAVANAHPQVKAAARVVLNRRGGDGAVREIAERMLAVQA
ncbi:acylneuraminate cytidylyltransferase [Microbacterium bovistercoris]|uniref:N-acylneuraminate cytidylyltransferase n=1 Tax=Microbacterium bovistercoris TaxID=2293570 RepID=A0A371NV57_9MICO|nr:acylneuraminate cytidylyltransferase [Microbacterium bovistercoris]REJ06217.1 acylneuraminate cytidylyltransferase [Microbacterium bovistercoris]